MTQASGTAKLTPPVGQRDHRQGVVDPVRDRGEVRHRSALLLGGGRAGENLYHRVREGLRGAGAPRIGGDAAGEGSVRALRAADVRPRAQGPAVGPRCRGRPPGAGVPGVPGVPGALAVSFLQPATATNKPLASATARTQCEQFIVASLIPSGSRRSTMR